MKMRTLREAAEALGVTVGRLRRGIRAGRYPSISVGTRLLVDLEALEEIVRREDAARESWIGTGRLCEMTGLRPGQIRRMCLEGQIPYRVDRSGHYRYQPTAVMAAIEQNMERGRGHDNS